MSRERHPHLNLTAADLTAAERDRRQRLIVEELVDELEQSGRDLQTVGLDEFKTLLSRKLVQRNTEAPSAPSLLTC